MEENERVDPGKEYDVTVVNLKGIIMMMMVYIKAHTHVGT